MKAIYIREFVKSLDEIKPYTIPKPSVTAATQKSSREPHYLIKITHVSPTHVDTLYARGLHQNNNRERGHVHPPFTLGSEFSGVIVEEHHASASSSLTKSKSMRSTTQAGSSLKVGDKVWGTWLGAFATHIVAPASALHLLPPNLSLRDAAALGASTAPVSYGALIQIARLKKGETCLVHAAAGGLGVVAVQIALAVGANVIGTVSSNKKATVIEDLMRRFLGFSTIPKGSGVVKYDRPGWEDRVKELCGGHGVDVVFDTVGLVEKSIHCCNFNARVIIIGFVGRDGQMEKVAMNRVLLKQIQLLGYRFGETSRRMPEETVETWAGLDEMLDRGNIRPVIHREFQGLDSMPEALKLMTTREVAGKIVVEVDDEEDDLSSSKSQSEGGETRSRL